MLLNEQFMSLEIEASYQPSIGKNSVQKSNMVILEVSLPSGFILSAEELNSLKSAISIVKLIETKNNDTVAIIYFEYLTSKSIDLKIMGFRKHIVTEQRPTAIIIYDYYDNGKEILWKCAKITNKLIFCLYSQRLVHANSIHLSRYKMYRSKVSNGNTLMMINQNIYIRFNINVYLIIRQIK